MELFELTAILLTLAALLSYLNYRFVHLPPTVGIMSLALVLSGLTLALGELGPLPLRRWAAEFLAHIDLNKALLHGMLAYLLFAGALHVRLSDLRAELIPVLALATLGVAISTLVVGGLTWWVLQLAGLPLSMAACLLFGALISPTDPIAVMAIMRSAGAPRSVETQITGESLFNDGVGVVAFTILLAATTSDHPVTPITVLRLIAVEVLGGVAFGMAAGYLTYRMLRGVDNYRVEILLTLALATSGYALADRLGLSAPLAIVVAGLFIGNLARAQAMSDQTRENLDTFWELVDDILNAVLFLLIGLEVLILPLRRVHLLAAALTIPIPLLARFTSVAPLMVLLGLRRPVVYGVSTVLTWAGLRGAISVALALSLPASEARSVLVTCTYAVVVTSILVQGLTIGPLLRRLTLHPIIRPREAAIAPATPSAAPPGKAGPG